jgi:YgiT-type zinc finger domain-containing protein
MSEDDNESREFCESCHVGSLRPYHTIYAHWHSGEFVIVPGVPAWRCDFCGDTFFDNEALSRLVLLLGLDSNTGGQRRWRTTGLEESGVKELGDRWRVC